MASTALDMSREQCFSCGKCHVDRFYKYNSKKYEEEDVFNKVSLIFRGLMDIPIKEVIAEAKLGVCRPCLNKLNSTVEWINATKDIIKSVHINRDVPVHDQKEVRTPEHCPNLVKQSSTSQPTRRALFAVNQHSKESTNKTSLAEHAYSSSRNVYDHTYPGIQKSPCVEGPTCPLENTGYNSNPHYELPQDENFPEGLKLVHQQISKSRSYIEVAKGLMSIPAVNTGFRKCILQEVDNQCASLCKMKINPSILRTYKSAKAIQEESLFLGIIEEMKKRCPFLLDILCTVSSGCGQMPDQVQVAPLALVYAILMKLRNKQLSALQRLLTIIAVKGHADDMLITRLNKLQVTVSNRSKIDLLDECNTQSHEEIVGVLKYNLWPKIIGDNLDLYIRTGQQTLNSQHKDLHMFTSLITFSRIPNLLESASGTIPKISTSAIKAENLLSMPLDENSSLIQGYSVILGRILSENLETFHWMKPLLPLHIPHRLSSEMAKKTILHSLPLLFKNEAKYEDCVAILHTYETQLTQLYAEAYGTPEKLNEIDQIPVGGDQLTHVRFEVAKNLRLLASVPTNKLSHLGPMVGEMWHNKRDLLEKAYKRFLNQDQQREQCSLYALKLLLHRSDVNGNVKSNYSAHADLFREVGKQFIVSQSMEYFGMTDRKSHPEKNSFPVDISAMPTDYQAETAKNILLKYLSHHKYGVFELDTCTGPNKEKQLYEVTGTTSDGNFLIKPLPDQNDYIYNYCTQLCHWALHLMELDDTAKEGDMERLVENCKYNIPLFYSHSNLSKYLVENIDLVLKTRYICSERTSLRILEGSFVNVHGGKGRNVEADLVQEHSVRTRKDLIRALGANKTEKAMLRATGASDAVQTVVEAYDCLTDIKPKSTKHTRKSTESDQETIQKVLFNIKPFCKTPGRNMAGKHLNESPFQEIDKSKMCSNIDRIIGRLTRGVPVFPDENSIVEDESDQEEIPDL